MASYFPKMLLPNSLADFYKDWKNNIDKYIEPTKPVEPIKPREPEAVKHDFVAALAVYCPIGFFVFIFSKNLLFVIFGLLIWSILYLIYNLLSLRKYKLNKKKYELECIKHQTSFSIYQNQITEYKKQLDLINALKTDSNWLEQKRLEITNTLMTVIKKPIIDYTSRKGSSEKQFEKLLNVYFGHLIITDKTTKIFSYSQNENFTHDFDYEFSNGNKQDNAYVPDFIFMHDKSNMIIDIEIDEPYTHAGPIHIEGNNIDKKRNDYFTSINWFVIRFSERQILQYPINCCREIALLIKDYTGDTTFLNIIEVKEEVPRDKMWDYLTAKEYSNTETRKNYTKLLNTVLYGSSIIGNWIYNGKIYSIGDNNITEMNKLDSKETDEGIYRLMVHPCGRLVMVVKWQKNQSKYILNRGWDQDLILTDLYNRKQLTFQQTKIIDYNRGLV